MPKFIIAALGVFLTFLSTSSYSFSIGEGPGDGPGGGPGGGPGTGAGGLGATLHATAPAVTAVLQGRQVDCPVAF